MAGPGWREEDAMTAYGEQAMGRKKRPAAQEFEKAHDPWPPLLAGIDDDDDAPKAGQKQTKHFWRTSEKPMKR